MICFEIPTNSYRELQNVISAASDSDFTFAVVLNGDEFGKDDEVQKGNIIAEFYEPRINKPCISMSELRRKAADIADSFNPEFRIIADGNFQFKKGWQDFMNCAAGDLRRFMDLSGREALMGMGGALGSQKWGSRPHITLKPIYETCRGIMYPSSARDAWETMPILAGGFEEAAFTSHLIVRGGLIPLKKFKSPITHKTASAGPGVGIHDREIWKENNQQFVADTWDDEHWNISKRHKHTQRRGQPKDGPYYYPQPRKSFEFMCRLRRPFLDDPAFSGWIEEGYVDKQFKKRWGK